MLKQNLVLAVVCIALVTFLTAANVAKIDKDTSDDRKAHEHSIASLTLGFIALGVVFGSMLRTNHNILLVLSALSAALIGLTFYSYDKLNSSTSEKNKTERKVALASFCLALIALVLGFSNFFVTYTEKMFGK
jgi:cytochrome c oxidase assembly factor CtaG